MADAEANAISKRRYKLMNAKQMSSLTAAVHAQKRAIERTNELISAQCDRDAQWIADGKAEREKQKKEGNERAALNELVLTALTTALQQIASKTERTNNLLESQANLSRVHAQALPPAFLAIEGKLDKLCNTLTDVLQKDEANDIPERIRKTGEAANNAAVRLGMALMDTPRGRKSKLPHHKCNTCEYLSTSSIGGIKAVCVGCDNYNQHKPQEPTPTPAPDNFDCELSGDDDCPYIACAVEGQVCEHFDAFPPPAPVDAESATTDYKDEGCTHKWRCNHAEENCDLYVFDYKNCVFYVNDHISEPDKNVDEALPATAWDELEWWLETQDLENLEDTEFMAGYSLVIKEIIAKVSDLKPDRVHDIRWAAEQMKAGKQVKTKECYESLSMAGNGIIHHGRDKLALRIEQLLATDYVIVESKLKGN